MLRNKLTSNEFNYQQINVLQHDLHHPQMYGSRVEDFCTQIGYIAPAPIKVYVFLYKKLAENKIA